MEKRKGEIVLVLKRIQLSLLLCFFFFLSFYIYNNYYFPPPLPPTLPAAAPAFVTVEVLAPSLGGGVG